MSGRRNNSNNNSSSSAAANSSSSAAAPALTTFHTENAGQTPGAGARDYFGDISTGGTSISNNGGIYESKIILIYHNPFLIIHNIYFYPIDLLSPGSSVTNSGGGYLNESSYAGITDFVFNPALLSELNDFEPTEGALLGKYDFFKLPTLAG